MKNITDAQMDAILEERTGIECFVLYGPAGKVIASGTKDGERAQETVGTWKQEEGHKIVVLFDDETIYKVAELKVQDYNKEKETKVKKEHTQCACLTGKGEPCKNNATHERDGKMVCGPHKKAKTANWASKKTSEVNSALEEGAMTNPESTKEGVSKMRKALGTSKKKEERIMEDLTVILANVFYKDSGDRIFYESAKWENVSGTREDLIKRARAKITKDTFKVKVRGEWIDRDQQAVIINKTIITKDKVEKVEEVDVRTNKKEA